MIQLDGKLQSAKRLNREVTTRKGTNLTLKASVSQVDMIRMPGPSQVEYLPRLMVTWMLLDRRDSWTLKPSTIHAKIKVIHHIWWLNPNTELIYLCPTLIKSTWRTDTVLSLLETRIWKGHSKVSRVAHTETLCPVTQCTIEQVRMLLICSMLLLTPLILSIKSRRKCTEEIKLSWFMI